MNKSMKPALVILVYFGSFLVSSSVDPPQTKPLSVSSHSDLASNVTVTCDGPTTLGGTTSFLASLYPDSLSSKSFIYVWKDSSFRKQKEDGQICTFEKTYFLKYDIRNHIMVVDVFSEDYDFIASGNVSFSVTEYINADIIMTQNSTVCNQLCYAATNNTLQLIVSIHDPSGFFRDSLLLLDWDFGDGSEAQKTTYSVAHIYSMIDTYGVSVAITAILPSGKTRSGMASITITTLNVIQNLTADGVDGVIVGEQQKINISCSGSPPISFCWSIYEDDKSSGLPVAESCLQTYLVEECSTEINYRFNESSRYVLKVRASNDVSFEALVARVDPKAPPDVLKPDGVAGVVIGILIGLTLTCICIGLMLQQIQKSRMRNVEVANFNFQAYPMYDSTREHARRLNEAANRLNENTPLLGRNPSLDVRWAKGNNTVSI